MGEGAPGTGGRLVGVGVLLFAWLAKGGQAEKGAAYAKALRQGQDWFIPKMEQVAGCAGTRGRGGARCTVRLWAEGTGLTLSALTSRGKSGRGHGTGAEQDGSAVLDSPAPGCPLPPRPSGWIQSWTEIQACSVPQWTAS